MVYGKWHVVYRKSLIVYRVFIDPRSKVRDIRYGYLLSTLEINKVNKILASRAR